MSNDIDNLNELPDVETGYQGEDYQAPSAFAKPPTPGEHPFQRVMDAENDFSAGTFIYQDKTYFWANFRVQVLGGSFDGRNARLGVNTMPGIDRKGTTADDFIRAAKSNQRPRTTKAYADTIKGIFSPFNAVVGWEWNCRDCKFDKPFLKGYLASSLKSPKKYDGPKVETKSIRTTEVTAAKGQKLLVADHVQVCPQCEQQTAAQIYAIRFVVPTAAAKTVTVPKQVVEGLPQAAG